MDFIERIHVLGERKFLWSTIPKAKHGACANSHTHTHKNTFIQSRQIAFPRKNSLANLFWNESIDKTLSKRIVTIEIHSNRFIHDICLRSS